MMPTGQPDPEPTSRSLPIRASHQDRDAVAQRLQQAFAEQRLDDSEFDQRIRAALTATTSADLDRLTADLPAATPGLAAPAIAGPKPGRFAVAYKSPIRRGGRWRVPKRFSSVVYKGSGWLDLRAAELTAPVTTVVAIAYKSRIDILLPPGVRVELGGLGVTAGGPASAEWDYQPPRDAPVVHVKGMAYKGTVEVTTRPPGSPGTP
jgi:Domain of unknown function (DUF1707)